MATPIDALYFQLGVDSSQLATGLNRARAMMQSGVKNIVSALAAPMMTALGGLASGAVVSSFIDQAEAARKLSDQLHVNMEDLQAWSNAAERAGGSAAGFQSSLTAIKSRLADFQTAGNVGAAQTFAMMGLPISGNPLDIMERLAERAETMGKMRFESWAKRVGLDAGTISFLQKGRAEIELLIKRQKEIGVYTKEDAEIARRARNAFLDLGQALKMGGGMIARIILPALEKLSDAMTDGIIYLRKHQPFVLAFLGLVTAALTKMAISAAAAFAPFIAIGAIFAGIALLVDDFVTYIQGGESALEEFWRVFGTGEEIASALGSAWEELKIFGKAFFSELSLGIGLFYDNFSLAFEGMIEIVKGLLSTFKIIGGDFTSFKDGIIQIFEGIKKVVPGIFVGVVKSIQNAFTGLKIWFSSFFSDAFDGVGDYLLAEFQSVIESIKKIFSELPSSLVSGVTSVFDSAKKTFSKVKESLGFTDDAQKSDVEEKHDANLPSKKDGSIILASPSAPYESVSTTSYNFATTNAQKNTSVNSRATFGDIYITSTATDGYQLGQDFLSVVSDPLQGMSFNVNSGVSQ